MSFGPFGSIPLGDATTGSGVITPPPAQDKSYFPEFAGGPPMRGAPWLHRLPVNPNSFAQASVPRPPIQAHTPEVTGGPPLRGAPWLQHLPLTPVLIRTLAQTVLDTPPAPQAYAPEIHKGPPIRGAPWSKPPTSAGLPPFTPPNPVPPDTTNPGGGPNARPSPNKFFLAYDPLVDPRLRRLTQGVTDIVNALIREGFLVQDAAADWSIHAGGFALFRAPTVNDDRSIGVAPGMLWINLATNAVYVNANNSIGSAVWVLVSGGGGGGSGGLSGTFP